MENKTDIRQSPLSALEDSKTKSVTTIRYSAEKQYQCLVLLKLCEMWWLNHFLETKNSATLPLFLSEQANVVRVSRTLDFQPFCESVFLTP